MLSGHMETGSKSYLKESEKNCYHISVHSYANEEHGKGYLLE